MGYYAEVNATISSAKSTLDATIWLELGYLSRGEVLERTKQILRFIKGWKSAVVKNERNELIITMIRDGGHRTRVL
jgi:hypothetical protein